MQRNHQRLQCLLAALSVSGVLSVACNTDKKATPVAEVRTESPAQVSNQPQIVTGCLRAGDADDIFVLTTAQTTGAEQTANYRINGPAGVDLRSLIGKQVEVNGVTRMQQEDAARTSTPPANRPTGTSGTPTIETKTVVDIKTIDANSIRPLDAPCPK